MKQKTNNINIKKTYTNISGKLIIFLGILLFVHVILLPEKGLKLGPQQSDFENGGFDISRYKVGLFVTLKIGDRLIFQPEIYFSQMGTKELSYFRINDAGNGQTSQTWTYRDTRSYVEVPLLFKYSIPLKGNVRPFVFAGGYVALRINKTKNRDKIEADFPENYAIIPQQDFDGNWSNKVIDYNDEYFATYSENIKGTYGQDRLGIYDIPPATKTFDGGMVFGFGLETGGKKTKIIFDWRMNIGFLNIYKTNVYTFGYYTTTTKNHSMSFMVGVSF